MNGMTKIGQPPLTYEQVSNLLCSAFEGGSNYWYLIEKFHRPTVYDYHTWECEEFHHIDYPLNYGGYLIITTLEKDNIKGKTSWILNLSTINHGIGVMYNHYPSHFGDILKGDTDAITGDVFLQCCLFGEVIFE